MFPLPIELQDIVKSYIFVPFDKIELKLKIADVLGKKNHGMKIWNVKLVRDMSSLLADKNFNVDISQWDVSMVTNMSSMFGGASSFNQSLSSWNVSNVRNMSWMFCGAESFNQSLECWDVSILRMYDKIV